MGRSEIEQAAARRGGRRSPVLASRKNERVHPDRRFRMPTIRDLHVRNGQVLLMAGTAKGVFLFASGPKRARWERGGPHFAGSPAYALAHDEAQGHRLFAGVENPF